MFTMATKYLRRTIGLMEVALRGAGRQGWRIAEAVTVGDVGMQNRMLINLLSA